MSSDRTANPVLVEAMRGDTRESAHRGAIAVLDADGKRLVALGDIDRPVFPRSAVKLLQAIPLVESGAADRLALDDEELAIACASHNGEPEHVAVVERMLAKAGLDVDALECGTHWPRHRQGRQRHRRRRARAERAQQQLLGQARRLPLPRLRALRRGQPAPVREGLCRAAPPGDARRHRGARGGDRPRPPAGAARHRRLLDPHLRDPARPPRPRLRADRHRHRPSPRPRARGDAAAGRRSRSIRSWRPAATASTPP